MTSDLLAPLDVVGRLPRLHVGLADWELDALLVTNLANVRYLTGFGGSAGALLVTEARALLVTDGRYRTQAAEQLRTHGVEEGVELSVGGAQAQRDAIVAAVSEVAGSATRPGRVGLEADDVTWSAQRRWADALTPAEPVPTSGLVEGLRQVKDAGELARMQKAAIIADAALASVLPMLRTGRTERDVALALDTTMREMGADDRAFETIVASGTNAAKPHARPSARGIQKGDPVVIDFGAVFDGYRSDMTRTFSVGGRPRGTLARVFDVVTGAQRAGIEAVRSGVMAGDVDHVCRQIIAEAGWGDAFEHGTGHGIGLDVHEAPTVGPGSTAILSAGVVVTVEPGVYLAGVGGVRVEDTVVVTEQGCRPLTTFPKEVAA